MLRVKLWRILAFFRDLTTASLSPMTPASRTRRKPKARSSKIENCHASAVFRNCPGRAQPEAMIETIFGEQRDGAGFMLKQKLNNIRM